MFVDTYRVIFKTPEVFIPEPCLCHIIPPHIEKHLKEHHIDSVRELARTNFDKSEGIRSLRAGAELRNKEKAVQKYKIYDAHHEEDLPGELVDMSSSQDASAKRAYAGAIKVYEYFREVHGRNSVNDKNMSLNSTVHYGDKYDNAFWEGSQMVYGDGDGVIFDDFTVSFDVIAHELSHGVTQYVNGLIYHGQSGALNESNSDVYGSFASQYALKQTVDQADWLIGNDLLLGEGALRSVKAPGTAYVDNKYLGTDPQPDRMSAYNPTEEDNGGVHINSGIVNRAAYLTCEKVGGYSWEKVGQIWYKTNLEIRSTCNFAEFAAATIRVTERLYGRGKEWDAIQGAWMTVEVNPAA